VRQMANERINNAPKPTAPGTVPTSIGAFDEVQICSIRTLQAIGCLNRQSLSPFSELKKRPQRCFLSVCNLLISQACYFTSYTNL
jgi:hypothetical protein